MKAVKWTAYGGPEVLKLVEREKPVPKKNEVLVKVHATAVTIGDCRLRGFKVPLGMWLPTRLAFGVFKPRSQAVGMDFSGVITAVGEDVSLFSQGDRVFGSMGMSLGANAESICISENKPIVTIPDSLSYTDAVALIFGGFTALHFLTDAVEVKKGWKVLINGASGSVGTAAIQVSKFKGSEVTAVCSASNHELVKSLGADHVIDYKTSDFTDNGVAYDVIVDAVGNLSYLKCKHSLAKTGKLLLLNADLTTILISLFHKKIISGVAGESKKALNTLVELFLSGNIKPVIDTTYPLEQIVEAHRYVDKGHKRGNVILTVE